MLGLEILVIIGLTIIGGGALARKLRLPPPLVLLVLGAALGFIPFLSGIALPPDLVILLFLPALLYWESLNTSLREIRRNLRVIVLSAIVLVLVTAGVVAAIAHGFGMPWPIAFVLGAILAPTDATAVASVAGHLPRRNATILRAESLINDGTALVVYAIALGAAVSGTPITLGFAALQFVASYAVGIAIGIAVGLVVVQIRKLVHDKLLVNTLSVVTPFVAYLPAEYFHVSGVVAVVSCGLLLSQTAPRLVTASMREQSFGFWQLSTFILNGALFILIGFELHTVTEGLGSGWAATVGFGLIIAVAIFATRLVWSNTIPYVIRFFDRRPVQRTRRIRFRQRIPNAWAGFRGAVSLAAALALPTTTSSGAPLPYRDLIIATTFIDILFTLVVQGLTMPAIVRWAKLDPDPTEFDEELLAEQTGLRAELDALPAVAATLDSPPATVDAVRSLLEHKLSRIHREDGHPELAAREPNEVDLKNDLQSALVPKKREAIDRLRREGLIDDVVQRRVQARLDLEELRLAPPPEDGT
ncbi:Na+/H+ antiporter [Subtercola lobariae]|uniref:Na(+)/H(+) exchanger n=1 Tax=Subtercola lobariae TaxID=1588641 RepID=A0A917B240_9MICO|nr:Na+/H+ antiporter [Subtercola lobariae]GGF16270.1 putative Na(+)/H(+) exchanger [Subtercola lobariae]